MPPLGFARSVAFGLALSGAVANQAAEECPAKAASGTFFEFGNETTGHLKSDDGALLWEGLEASADFARGDQVRKVRLLKGLLRQGETDALVDVARSFTADNRMDSIDGLPAYEHYIRQQGVDKHAAASTVLPAIEARLRAFARDRYSCPDCFVCSVLLRRYLPMERNGTPSHFDRMAFLTAVASLNVGKFEGGLFLQRTPHVSSRQYLETQSGNVIFHQYDLNHGVQVDSGKRFSAIFWITDTERSCKEKLSPWYVKDAEAGNVEAQYALSELHRMGKRGYPRDNRKAFEWMRRSAEGGNAEGQEGLGRAYLSGREVQKDKALGVEWVKKAAEQGYAPAQHTLGTACKLGDAEGGLEEASRWFREAAKQDFVTSQLHLGLAYKHGHGVAKNLEVAFTWFEKAALKGFPAAMGEVAEAYDAGMGVKRNQKLAKVWFKKAEQRGYKRKGNNAAKKVQST